MPPIPLPNRVVSSLTVGLVGTASKLFLSLACTTKVSGLEHLYEAWKEEHRQGKGIITVANHISVMDEPLMWGILPLRSFFRDRTSRWTLGAQDIMYTNKLLSSFFNNGKCVETVRGAGIYQSAIDFAIQRLDTGDWVHLFPQGFVRQETLGPPIKRLKWGVGRMLAECKHTPTVIPIWINGFEQVMPENRGFPKFLPRPGANISISIGDPTNLTMQLHEQRKKLWTGDEYSKNIHSFHSETTAIIERALDELGHKAVSST
ncbi:Tafazzin [Serendipita indica DSM 11827]|uniref:Tafazzin family protein n=1 Tax=Serendipita indica (strain DSM 11827) TaxID=1109443 RepID=G4TEX1_SERID|nr:Tafazzin [Serendipita indica DSM 11827]CCA69864.1 related to TAZ1-Lyso-phosphatidylcholine acyltransferase [Serendipita indica DSM 11827]